jgi:hypothetical protein
MTEVKEEKEVKYLVRQPLPDDMKVVKDAPVKVSDTVSIHARFGDLIMAMEDFNGEYVYQSEQAAFGYINDSEKLVLPSDMKQNIGNDMKDLSRLALSRANMLKIYTLNYLRLLNGGLDPVVSAWCSWMRTKCIEDGLLIRDVDKRAVTVDEVIWVDDAVATNQIEEALSRLTKPIIALINLSFRAWISMLVIVFHGRGHHWKPELNERYEKLWRACVIESSVQPISWQHLTRTAIHPFGIARPARYFEAWCLTNNIPKALQLRRSAMPAGRAYLGVLKASFDEMRAHTWWQNFYVKFQDQVQLAEQKVIQIKSERYRHHYFAKIFGYTGADAANSDVIDQVKTVVPYVQAYINIMATGTPLADQKSVKKLADSTIGKVRDFERMLINWQRAASNAATIGEFIDAL